ncbi:MAG: metallophosphoesterase [Frankiales bacterium]|nr:metallophosphoesterase [Frankiales bacterium]
MLLPPLVALGVAAAGWPFVEPHLPVLRRVRVPVPLTAGPSLRVLHLSDLHLMPGHRRRAAWVRGLARVQPDLVVSTGDHWSSAASFDLLVSTLSALTADGTPAVLVPGNNDYFTPVLPSARLYRSGRGAVLRRTPDLPWAQVVAALAGAGWTDLAHRRVQLDVAGRTVTLTGTDDAHLRRDRYDEIAGPATGLAIGVVHTPARRLLRRFAADGYALVLAGHTHGGQLRAPLLGPVTTNCDLERSRARGLSALDGPGGSGWLHVSAGLGTSPYLPVRLCCRPEATLLELVPTTTGA